MTEAEWLACEDPEAMLRFLAGRASDRKLRLFGCACCRRVWSALGRFECDTVDVAELFADGLTGGDELDAATRSFRAHPYFTSAWVGGQPPAGPYAAANAASRDRDGLFGVAACAVAALLEDRAGPAADAAEARARERVAQAVLVRDLFGNPFRSVPLPPALRTPTITTLTATAYNERHLPSGHLDNARLAVLSDALEEAGCTDAALLAHLRSPGPHVRGCWALDLVLGKQ